MKNLLAKLKQAVTLRNAVIVAVVVAALGVGYIAGHRSEAPAPPAMDEGSAHDADAAVVDSGAGATSSTFWTCPMHPEIVQDGPGDCPICGMDLVERSSDGAGDDTSEVAGLVSLQLSERDQQLIGVTSEVLKNRRLKRDVRAYGNVEADETSLHTVNAKVGGWIEKLHVDYTGKPVSAGQALLSIYSPELVQTQEEYLLALRAQDKLGSSRFPEVANSGTQLLDAARRRLELWDISADQIRRLEKTGESTKTLVLHAPTSGIVMERHATEGMQVMPGMPLFKLADLSRVWVQASLYDIDIPLIDVGMEADVTIEGLPGRTFTGAVTFIEPVMGQRSRSARARVELDNSDGAIKPNMYATVKIRVPLGEVLALPREAVLDTGQRKIVFVDQGDGHFEPREVGLGRETDDYFEVLSGVFADEKIVTSGNFMIDSESRTQASIRARMREAAADGEGGELWTCPMHPQIMRDTAGDCPICGMDLVPVE